MKLSNKIVWLVASLALLFGLATSILLQDTVQDYASESERQWSRSLVHAIAEGVARNTVDGNRLAMLIAVLEKHAGLRLADQDIFASSVGGMRIAEPAGDLAIALAICGAHYNRKLEAGVCAVGEIGLGGEVRHVQQMSQRLTEAARLGFTRILTAPTKLKAPSGADVIAVKTVGEALEHLN